MKELNAKHRPLWRDEFSIDQATDLYVTRRQFSKFLVLTSLGMFAGNLWILIRNLVSAAGLLSSLSRWAQSNDVAVGERQAVLISDV